MEQIDLYDVFIKKVNETVNDNLKKKKIKNKNEQNSQEINNSESRELSEENLQLSSDNNVKFYTYEDIEETTIALIISKEYIPISLENYQKIFLLMDPDQKGLVPIDYIVSLLKQVEPPYTDTEISRFLQFSNCTIDSKFLNYRNYIINYFEFVNQHIKKIFKLKENMLYCI